MMVMPNNPERACGIYLSWSFVQSMAHCALDSLHKHILNIGAMGEIDNETYIP